MWQHLPHRCHICTRTGLTPATSAPGPGSPHPHLLHRNWNHPCHICIATGLTPATVHACVCACMRACVWGAREEVHCRAECQRDGCVSSQCPRTAEELKSRRPPHHCAPPGRKASPLRQPLNEQASWPVTAQKRAAHADARRTSSGQRGTQGREHDTTSPTRCPSCLGIPADTALVGWRRVSVAAVGHVPVQMWLR